MIPRIHLCRFDLLSCRWLTKNYSCSFLCSPKEMNQRKGAFFEWIFQPSAENHSWLAKFPPGLRKFLTPISYYPAKKGFIRCADNNSNFTKRCEESWFISRNIHESEERVSPATKITPFRVWLPCVQVFRWWLIAVKCSLVTDRWQEAILCFKYYL